MGTLGPTIFQNNNLVGGLEHFLLFHILGTIIPTDENIFFRGVGTPPTSRSSFIAPSLKAPEASSGPEAGLRTPEN
jgi:hypothetical protein